MKRYFIGLGSNIDPEVHVPKMIAALLEISPVLYVSRVIETAPIGIEGEANFYNTAVSFVSELDTLDLKTRFNRIESALGRDHTDPDSKGKSRTADIDILFEMDAELDCAELDDLPVAPFIRPQTIELISYLGLDCHFPEYTVPAGIKLRLDDVEFGGQPETIRKN
jgi:2-amino-4-hydroxy-6-hydroxymethyldihydropteridine diphosphokinase